MELVVEVVIIVVAAAAAIVVFYRLIRTALLRTANVALLICCYSYNNDIFFLQLGDPNDNSLRRVERENVIPQRMRDKAKELCASEVAGMSCTTPSTIGMLCFFFQCTHGGINSAFGASAT